MNGHPPDPQHPILGTRRWALKRCVLLHTRTLLRPLLLSLSLFILTVLVGCGSTRQPIPPGEIPTQTTVPVAEEQYGQQVLSELSERFPLDTDDARILRVRAIVDKLTNVRGNNQNIWHVYVLKDDTFHNAAATRGNHVFVWSALVNAVPEDPELATIIAHEIGHVLAGHTEPDPSEAVNEMLASISGEAAYRVMVQSGYPAVAGLAQLGGLLASELAKALIVNPDKQALELEADHIGLFLMAEAGYEPEAAIRFWTRAMNDPNFQSSSLEFLSTHPSSETRLTKLKAHLPEATARFKNPTPQADTKKDSIAAITSPTSSEKEVKETTRWISAQNDNPVFIKPDSTSDEVGQLVKGEAVTVKQRLRRWLQISSPYEGFVESHRLYPDS